MGLCLRPFKRILLLKYSDSPFETTFTYLASSQHFSLHCLSWWGREGRGEKGRVHKKGDFSPGD